MTWVKVCGLTREADVAAAVAAGADAIGLVAISSSPRHVSLPRARELARDVPVHTILLTLDLDPSQAVAILERTGVNGIQPYGKDAEATAAVASDGGFVVLYPQRADQAADVIGRPGIPLLDTPSQQALGGTGRTFDWELTADLDYRFILAGGLNPENIAAAVKAVAPWGVDASSGLEESPGKKDHSMVADFITIAKNT